MYVYVCIPIQSLVYTLCIHIDLYMYLYLHMYTCITIGIFIIYTYDFYKVGTNMIFTLQLSKPWHRDFPKAHRK